jgi:hypothetical protein
MQPISLPACGESVISFIHSDLGGCPPQPLRQAQPAKPASGHRHPEFDHARLRLPVCASEPRRPDGDRAFVASEEVADHTVRIDYVTEW